MFIDPVMWGFGEQGGEWSTAWAVSTTYFATALMLGIWYNQSVLNIELREPRDEKGRIPTAFNSFMVSMRYLALMFVTMILALAAYQLALGLLLVAGGREAVRAVSRFK
jgi:hypothetical protein